MFPFKSDWTTLNAAEPRRSQVGCLLGARGEGYAKGRLTEKADEAFRSTQEGESVYASIGDGDVCEGLIRGSDCRISTIGWKGARQTVTVSR